MSEVLSEEVGALQAIFEDRVSVSEASGESGSLRVTYTEDELSISFVCGADYPRSLPFVSCPMLRRLNLLPELTTLMEGLRDSQMLFQAIEFTRDRIERFDAAVESQLVLSEEEPEEGPEETGDPSTAIQILHGEPLHDRRSVFQAHLAFVSSMDEVRSFREAILSDKKFARATHNIFAYRFECPTTHVVYHDYDDDGETAAGGRLAELLRLMGISGVAVIVSRWFGGVLLGADRFKLINNCARSLLEQQGLGLPSRQGPVSSSRAKKGRAV